MFWIYGGGYIMGSTAVPAYDGVGLASKGVGVVSINCRFGLCGFLALKELDAESPHKVSSTRCLGECHASVSKHPPEFLFHHPAIRKRPKLPSGVSLGDM